MKAIVYRHYGSPEVVSVAEVPKPAPKDNEVLIRIHATTVTTGDWRARSLKMPAGFGFMGRIAFGVFGPRKPILGTELAGVIEEVGRAVTRFKAGDEVFAFPGASFGGHAEYRTMSEDGLIAQPSCPAHLSPTAKAEWKRLAQTLNGMGLLTQIDRAALAAYCQAYGRWVEAERKLAETPILLKTPAGYVQPSPWLAISNKQLELMAKFMAELGLTPSARSRVTVQNPSLRKPWDFPYDEDGLLARP